MLAHFQQVAPGSGAIVPMRKPAVATKPAVAAKPSARKPQSGTILDS
jgi:hypothetical protein